MTHASINIVEHSEKSRKIIQKRKRRQVYRVYFYEIVISVLGPYSQSSL